MRWKVFYSYSHNDKELRDQLAMFLAPLRHQGKIEEWHDRKIEPGTDWNKEISKRLEDAHLILPLVSADFLASEYCFGIEIETALARLKRGLVQVVPVLLKPCLWQESRFSEFQFIPRGGKPVASWTSREEALADVAAEIRDLVAKPPQLPPSTPSEGGVRLPALEVVQGQVLAYARLYERIRQRMPASNERTARMEQVLVRMRELATASYSLLNDLTKSPSPGERLAAVAILQVFADERYLPFLVSQVESEKPFVCYHALKALRCAVDALDLQAHAQLDTALRAARAALEAAGVGLRTDRHNMLREAEDELRSVTASLAAPPESA